MIDIHSHLLPGIDDGPPDLERALAMCQLAAADGTTAMVATPHLRHERWWNGDRPRLEQLAEQLRQAAPAGLEIHLGGEIAVRSQIYEEIPRLPDGDLLTLAGSRYVLLEFHPRGLGPEPQELVHELRVGGWVPILAHPERISWLMRDLALLERLIAEGALLQLTAMSVIGAMGKIAHLAAKELLDAGWVHFLASDAHDVTVRPPGLRAAYWHVAQSYGEPLAHALCFENPRAVLENRPLNPHRAAC